MEKKSQKKQMPIKTKGIAHLLSLCVPKQLSYFVGSRWPLQNRGSQKRMPNGVAPPVCQYTNNSIFSPFVRVLFGRGAGEPFSQKGFPRSSYQISNNFLNGVIYAAALAASEASAKMRSRGSVPEKRQMTKESSEK